MRVLILSAILACATAAPATILAAVPLLPAPINIPPIPSGDLQAAAIDAKVQAEDQARLLEDQARLAADIARDQAELAVGDQKETIEEVDTSAKEKSEEQFWNVEDKKWQAVDAVKTVEAKLDGEVASNAPAIAKSLTFPVITHINPGLPYTSLVYTPNLIPFAPEIKDDKLVKTADPDSKGESEKKEKDFPKFEGLAFAPTPLIGAPWIQAPITFYQPGYFGSPLPLQPILTPAVLK